MEENKPVRVLHVLTGLSSGGAESFIMNMYRNMDRKKVQFDFLLRSTENVYEEELRKMGSRVYVTAAFPKHFIQNALQTSRFFREHRYDIIHVHANALLYMFALNCARRNGVKCRIIHSHNSAMAHMRLLPIHNANKKRIHKLATDFFACSESAGKWMFDGDFTVVHNAIDLDTFAYDAQKREKLRTELGIGEQNLVLGHIGRFAAQKNHSFLIDIFAEVVKAMPESKLVLLGDGELREAAEDKVRKLNLSDRVLFLGTRKDVAELVNVFDLFVFPSLYEGLAIVALEAQANGLPVVCSEQLADQTLFGTTRHKLSLNENAVAWAKYILSVDSTRQDLRSTLAEAGYDIRKEAQKLQNFYLSKVE